MTGHTRVGGRTAASTSQPADGSSASRRSWCATVRSGSWYRKARRIRKRHNPARARSPASRSWYPGAPAHRHLQHRARNRRRPRWRLDGDLQILRAGRREMQRVLIDWVWIDERCGEDVYSGIARPHHRDRRHHVPELHAAERRRRTDLPLPERIFPPIVATPELRLTDADTSSAERRATAGRELSAARARGPHPRHSATRHRARFPFPIDNPDRQFDPDTDIKSWAQLDGRHRLRLWPSVCGGACAHGCTTPTSSYVVDGFKHGAAPRPLSRQADRRPVPRAAHPDCLAARRPAARERLRSAARRAIHAAGRADAGHARGK